MTTLIDAHHEVQNWSEWTSAITDGGDLSITSNAGLAGSTYGMELLIDDTVAIYAYYNSGGSARNYWRFRLYVDPNTLTLANTYLSGLAQLQTSLRVNFFRMWLFRSSGGTSQLYISTQNDGGSYTERYTNISFTEPHWIEVAITRASSDVASDGTVEFWIDGVAGTSITGIDNYDCLNVVGQFKVGAHSITSGVSGTYYIDEVVVNDDGNFIGPIVSQLDLRQFNRGYQDYNSGDTITVTYPGTPVEGNLLVAGFFGGSSISAGPSGWSTAVTLYDSGNNDEGRIFYKVAGASESRNVSVQQASADEAYLWIGEYQGPWESSPLDETQNAGPTTSVDADSGLTATTAQDSELAIGLVTVRKSVATESFSISWLNSFASVPQGTVTYTTSNYLKGIHVGFRELTSTGTYKAAGTLINSRVWMAGIATFTPTAGTIIPLVVYHRRQQGIG